MARARPVTTAGIQLLNDEASFVRTVTWPVFVWQTPPSGPKVPLLLATDPGQPPERSLPNKPVYFEIRKLANNAFAQQIAVGRTANNDISIEDNSVSRFHAYLLAPKDKRGWQLVDAESKVGTWVGATRLQPNVPSELYDLARVRFGYVELLFLEPPSFIAWLRKEAGLT